MFSHLTREPHGIRWFAHFSHRSSIRIEFYWWSLRFGTSLSSDDEGWTFSLRVPPIALWISLDGMLWQPKETHIATWDNDRSFTLATHREFSFYISEWRVHLSPWGRSMEWRSQDPWWVQGVSVDLKDLVLGRMHYHTETLGDPIPIDIGMPEGRYPALATLKRATRKRSRWLTFVESYYDVRIPKGVPFAGKGENSYDCDDDGLFGYSSYEKTLEAVAAEGATHVLNRRTRYGKPSQTSIDEALRA